MHKYMVFMVSAALGTGIAFADAADLPRFVDAQDACETLWRSEKYEQLYGYIDELKQKSPDYATQRVLGWLLEGGLYVNVIRSRRSKLLR